MSRGYDAQKRTQHTRYVITAYSLRTIFTGQSLSQMVWMRLWETIDCRYTESALCHPSLLIDDVSNIYGSTVV